MTRLQLVVAKPEAQRPSVCTKRMYDGAWWDHSACPADAECQVDKVTKVDR